MTAIFKKLDWYLLAAILLPLIAWLPTIDGGIPAAADVEVHVHRIHAMTLSLQEGNLYPRWISYFHLGYGYPIFNFYAPGATYITALFELVGLPIAAAYNLVNGLAWSFGSAGMYLLARRFFPAPVALLSAAIWVFAPSRLYEVWWQGSIAQSVSAAFIPWLLWGIVKNAEQPSRRRVLLIALPFAALILTHTPMMYISALYAAVLAFAAPLWNARQSRNWRGVLWRWLYIGGGFALGIGLATIFLMPTLLELRYVLISEGIDETLNYLQEQYIPLSEIFTLPRLLDQTDLYLDFPRTLGAVGGVLSLIGAVVLVRRKQYGLLLMTLAGMGVTVFMLLSVSYPVWLAIPSFENLRFPARLLRMGAVLVALLGGASVLWLPKRWQLAGAIAGVTLVIAQMLPLMQPYDARYNWENISAVDEIQHEAQDYTWGSVSYNEFNPIWGERIFHDVPTNLERYATEPFHLRVFGRDIAALNWQGLSEENIDANTLRVITEEARALRFRQYYFPGWQATLNGDSVPIYPDEQIGLITMDVPAGEHIISLTYTGTTVQHMATLITLASGALGVLLLITGNASEKATSHESASPRTGGLLIGGIVGFALLNALVIQPSGWLLRESPPDAPQYMATEQHATFESEIGEQVDLLGYTLHGDSISRNAPLNIDVYWRVPQLVENNYRPVVQLINLTQTEAWAVSQPLDPAAGTTSSFSPERFARDPHTLRLQDADVPPYVGRVSVQMRDPDGNALALPDGSDRLLLDPIIRVNTADTSTAGNSLGAQVGEVAQLRCVGMQSDDERLTLTLHWHLLDSSSRELVTLVHGLDADGNLVETGDAPPFGGNYPARFWREGQTLRDTYTLPADLSITQVALGLYTRDDVQRLPVTQNGNPAPNNQIIVPLEETVCQP